MARVTLDEPDRPGSVLPDVCLKCVRHAPDRTYLVFPLASPRVVAAFMLSWPLLLITPSTLVTVYVTVFLLRRVAIKRMGFPVPLCRIHSRGVFKRFWGIPLLAVLLLLAGLASLASGERIYGQWLYQGPGQVPVFVPPEPVGLLLSVVMDFVVCGLIFCVLFGVVLYHRHWPRATTVTDLCITLVGVSPEFVRAYGESRRIVRIPSDTSAPRAAARPAHAIRWPSY